MAVFDSFYENNRARPIQPSPAVVRMLPYIRGHRILDLGCGDGKDALFLARRGYAVTGVDVSRSGLEHLATQRDEESLDNLSILAADIEEWRPTENFDVVTSNLALHFLAPTSRRRLLHFYRARASTGVLHCLTILETGKVSIDELEEELRHDYIGWEILHQGRLQIYLQFSGKISIGTEWIARKVHC